MTDSRARRMIPNRPVSVATIKRARSLAEIRGSSRVIVLLEGARAMDDDLFVVDQLDDYRSICISTLGRKTVQDTDAARLGDAGYFIYEVDETPKTGGINILAKAVSMEAAFRLIEIWRSARHSTNRMVVQGI